MLVLIVSILFFVGVVSAEINLSDPLAYQRHQKILDEFDKGNEWLIEILDFNESDVVDGDVMQGDNVSFNVTVTDDNSEVESVWLKT